MKSCLLNSTSPTALLLSNRQSGRPQRRALGAHPGRHLRATGSHSAVRPARGLERLRLMRPLAALAHRTGPRRGPRESARGARLEAGRPDGGSSRRPAAARQPRAAHLGGRRRHGGYPGPAGAGGRRRGAAGSGSRGRSRGNVSAGACCNRASRRWRRPADARGQARPCGQRPANAQVVARVSGARPGGWPATPRLSGCSTVRTGRSAARRAQSRRRPQDAHNLASPAPCTRRGSGSPSTRAARRNSCGPTGTRCPRPRWRPTGPAPRWRRRRSSWRQPGLRSTGAPPRPPGAASAWT